MSVASTDVVDDGPGIGRLLVFLAAIVAFVAMWGLYVTAPPTGLVSPIGMAIPVVAAAYLLYVVYSYTVGST